MKNKVELDMHHNRAYCEKSK